MMQRWAAWFGTVVLGTVVLGTGLAWAEVETPAELEKESMVDLVYMGDVSVASKKSENINTAPGIVSVITAEEIKRLAAESLYDVVRIIPGVTLAETFFGYTAISFRGIQETHYNNRTLFLLNGHALRNVTVGNYWLESIPANVIDRIEVIRGPGSVIYGTGAFAGVINVVTKKEKDVAELGFLGGSKATKDGYATFGTKVDQASVMTGFSSNQSNGYNALVKDELGVLAPLGGYPKNAQGYRDNYYNAFGNFSWAPFSVDLYHFNQFKDKFGLVPYNVASGQDNVIASGAAGHYQGQAGPVALNAVVSYDQSAYNGYISQFPPSTSGTPLSETYSGYKLGADVDARAALLENLDLLTGVSYEFQKAYPYEWKNLNTGAVSSLSTFLREYSTYDASVYAQFEYALLQPLNFSGGVRYNHNQNYGDTLVPRAGLVYQVMDTLSVKALYGSAYRNPTFFEKYVLTKDVLYGEPDLKPEKINTYELGAGWMVLNHVLNLTLFDLSTDDMIGRVRSYNAGDTPAISLYEDRGESTLPSKTTPGYANSKGQEIYGVELEFKGSPWGNWLGYNLNASYKGGRDKVTEGAVQFLDKVVANLILTNQVLDFTNTVSLEYVGERKGNIAAGSAATGLATGQEITVPAYMLVNLKTTYAANAHVDLSLVVMNAFAQKVVYPEYIRRRIEGIPGDSGSNVFGEIRVKF